MIRMLLLLPLLLALPAWALDPPPGKEAAKDQRKLERELHREQRKADREWIKEQRKAEQEWVKEQRAQDREWLKAQRELQKAERRRQRDLAKQGWYDGEAWRDYREDLRYRDEQWEAVVRYPAPRVYVPPPEFEVIVFEPGMQLPQPWYRQDYRIEHHVYGLPPPPPSHHWVQVDDDAVLVALASGLVADFVYDLFE